MKTIQTKYEGMVTDAKSKLSDANTSYAGATADHKELQQQLKDARKLTEEVKGISAKASLASLIAKNAVAIATASSSDSSKVSDGINAASKAIDAMVQSVTIFVSGIASVYAKLSSEDQDSPQAKQAAGLFDKAKALALQAEKTSMLALEAAIRGAKTGAPKALETITANSTDIAGLSDALSKTLAGLQAQVADLEKSLNTSVTNEEAAELSVMQADNNLRSAQMIGGTNGTSTDAITKDGAKESGGKK